MVEDSLSLFSTPGEMFVFLFSLSHPVAAVGRRVDVASVAGL